MTGASIHKVALDFISAHIALKVLLRQREEDHRKLRNEERIRTGICLNGGWRRGADRRCRTGAPLRNHSPAGEYSNTS
jgi:hypothetical protein